MYWGTELLMSSRVTVSPEMPLTLAAKFDYRKLEEEITSRDY